MTEPEGRGGSRFREIRVFVSSTFRDMGAERDQLVKFVFPKLRKLCESRGVVWTDIDLRWGITEEQSAEGKVLPICLQEINKCRPCFIGLLGERYGHVDPDAAFELSACEPWVVEHVKAGSSVTEIEIIHGVLANPSAAEHAYFYFRDPAYSDRLANPARAAFVAESDAAKARLLALKERIRRSGLPVRENYPDPAAFGELVLNDFTALINHLYPEGSEPDILARERQAHEAVAKRHAVGYVPRLRYHAVLTEHARGNGSPLAVLGQPGAGKSALLANWARQHREENPDDFLILHCVGGEPRSADWAALVSRVLREWKRRFRVPDLVPTARDELRRALLEWQPKITGHGRTVLIIDGIDQLEDETSRELTWLPAAWHPSIRLIVSAAGDRESDLFDGRKWLTTTVDALGEDEKRLVIQTFLGLYARDIGTRRTERLTRAPQTGNALYLRTLLDELRQFGEHSQLDVRLEYYLAAMNPQDLFDRVLERWEQDYGGLSPHEKHRSGYMVRDALSWLWAARHGLSELELLELLGDGDSSLPRAVWTPFHLALEPALQQHSGLLLFGHEYMRRAVEARFLPHADERRRAHQTLADYFSRQPGWPERKLTESPRQHAAAHNWSRLLSTLTDLEFFLKQNARDPYELLDYWRQLGAGHDPAVLYSDAWERIFGDGWDDQAGAHVAEHIAIFLTDVAGDYIGGVTMQRRALSCRRRALGEDHPSTVASLVNLAALLSACGDYAESEQLFRQGLQRETALTPHRLLAARINLGSTLDSMGRYREAEECLRQSLAASERINGAHHETTCIVCGKVAHTLSHLGDYQGAEQMFRRAVNGLRLVKGQHHPSTLRLENDLGLLLWKRGDLEHAETVFRRVLGALERRLGAAHPDTLVTRGNLAGVLNDSAQYAEADQHLRESVDGLRQALGPGHQKTLQVEANLSSLLLRTGDLSAAEEALRRVLAVAQVSLPFGHPQTVSAILDLVKVLAQQRRFGEVTPLLQQALAIRETTLGADHPETIDVRSALEILLTNREHWDDVDEP